MTTRRALLVLLATTSISGCAKSGPGFIGPRGAIYEPKTGDMAMKASWFPNVVLGDSWANFNAPSQVGTLVVSPARIAFLREDEASKTTFIVWDCPVPAVTWITGKNHGVSRILQLQANGASQSFTFAQPAVDGTDKDLFLERTLALFGPPSKK